MRGFLRYVWVPTMHFGAIFTHKMAITEWKTTISEIKFKFILKTTCTKLFKMPGYCHVPLLCYSSRNGFFSYFTLKKACTQ